MEQDLNTCPSCGAPSPDHSSCPYCGWTLERPAAAEPAPNAVPSEDASHIDDTTNEALLNLSGAEGSTIERDEPQTEEGTPAQLRDLLAETEDPVHLLEQVPEEMRGTLAARLKAAEDDTGSSFGETTASTLREQGYIVSEDARGARLAATPGQSEDLSASDMVKMAADLDGGVQPQTKLPICSKCQAASPVGEVNCQWCGEPFSNEA